MKEFEEKLKDAEETRLAIKEELETFSLKQKCHFLGIVKFIGQLYRHQLTNEAVNVFYFKIFLFFVTSDY